MTTDGTLTKWIRLVLAAAMAIAVGMAITPSGLTSPVAEAASVVPETAFVIDGDRTGLNDFENPYGPGTTPGSLPTGGFPTTGLYYVDQAFDGPGTNGCDIDNDPSTPKGGTKIGDGPAYPTPGTDPNGKTDLDYIDLAAEKVNANGEIFDILYVGYRKCGGSGTWQTSLYLDDGDGVPPSAGDNGDYLFLFDFQPSSGNVDFRYYRRVGGVWQVQTGGNTFIDGSAAGDYGEVALNLTELLFTDPNGNLECNSLVVSGPAASITGGSFGLTSQPKDLLGFPPLRIDNCGAIDITKLAADGDATTADLFEYLLVQTDSGQVHDDSLTAQFGEPDSDLTEIDAEIAVGPSNTHLWQGVLSSTDYTLSENVVDLPPGWQLVGIECSYVDIFATDLEPTTQPDGSVLYEHNASAVSSVADLATSDPFGVAPATLGNVPVERTSCEIVNDVLGLTIRKTGNGDQVDFSFDVEELDDGQPIAPAVAENIAVAINGADVFQPVPATGSYRITEDDINALDGDDLLPDWTLTSIVCLDANDAEVGTNVNLAAGTVDVTVNDADDDITCTFNNEQAGRIIVEKVTDPDGAPDEFDFEFDDGNGANDPDPVVADLKDGDDPVTVEVAPGTFTITEVAPVADPEWVLTGVSCGPVNVDGVSVDVAVAAGEVVTCTFSNEKQGAIIVDKQVVAPGTTDVVTDQDATFTFELDDAPFGTITTVDGETSTGDELESNPVMPSANPYRVEEDLTATPGYTLESVECDDGTAQTGNGASVVVSSGEVVSCTFSNSRNQATFTLAKAWGTDTPNGDAVDLTADVSAGNDPSDAIATNAASLNEASVYNPADRSMTVYSGQTVDFSEAFTVGSADAYTSTLTCDAPGGGGSITPDTDVDGNTRAGVYVVGTDPVDVTCTFTNTPKRAGVTLQKEWVDATVGETADLSLSTGSGASDSDQSQASEPTFTDTANSAFVAVVDGDVVTFTESVSNDDNYTTGFTCLGTETGGDTPSNSPSQPDANDPYTWQLVIATADVQNGAAIICEFVNARNSVTLELTKDWDDSPASDDAVGLEIGPDGDVLAMGDSAVSGATNNASVEVLVGETYDIRENFTTGNADNYAISWSCNNVAADAGTGTAGTVAIASTDDDVLCTFVNDRRETTLTLEKAWVNGAPSDTAELTVDPDLSAPTGPAIAGVPDGGSGSGTAAVETVTVYAGENVALSEAFGADNVGTYDVTDFSCSGSANAAAGWDGASDLDATLAIDADATGPVTCTVTNTRRSALLTLVKTWDDPVGGVALTINAAGDDGNVGETISEATTSPTGTSGQMTIYSGETITLSETFTDDAADLDLFTSTLDCGAGNLGLTENPDGTWTASIEAGGGPQATTCTFDNVRNTAIVTLQKSWVFAQVDDTADLTIDGVGSDATTDDTATSVATQPVLMDITNVASLTVYAGERVTLSEEVVDGALYNSTLACANATNNLAGDADGDGMADNFTRSDTLDIAAGDADETIACTFTNTRRELSLTLDKDWGDSLVNDDSVALTIDGGLGEADPGSLANPAVDSNDGVDNDTTAFQIVYFGETVTLAESFTSGPAASPANYDTDLVCVDTSTDPDTEFTAGTFTYVDGELSGTFFVDPSDVDVAAAEDGVVRCTFTNVRKRTTLTLDKDWVDAVAGDTVELTATGNDGDLETDTDSDTAVASTGDGTSAETADITVYAGQTVTLSEAYGGGNTAAYDATAFSCTDGTVDPAWVAGQTSASLTVTADDVVAPITCTFTNEAQRGTIVIVKSIDGLNDGTFDFSGDWSTDGVTSDPAATDPANFSISTDGLTGTVTFTDVLIGSYSVSETDSGSNFDGTTVTCVEANGDNGSGPDGGTDLPLTGTIDLDDDETVTCTFTNTERSTIVIVKDAQPDAAQDFSFTTTDPTSPAAVLPASFDLDDDADGTLSNTYTSPLVPGGATYSVTELATAGWTLDPSSACTGGGSFDGTTATITPAPGATVTCTFVNTANPAGITATKAVDNQEGPWGPFEFTLSGGGFAGDPTQLVNSTAPTAEWTDLVQGEQYTLVENQVAGYVPGAEFTCQVKLPGDGTVFETLDDESDVIDGFQFTAVAGAIYDCDITNVAIDPTLVVEKTTVGGFGTFTFDVTPTDANFPVGPLTATTADGSNPADSETVDLQAGVGYSVAEQLSDLWVEGNLTCTVTAAADGSTPLSYAFDTPTAPGDTIECQITNTRRGEIIVEKQTDPDDALGEFGFEASWNGDADGVADFSLADDGTENSGPLDPGADYTITELTEAVAATFSLTNITCTSDGQASGTDDTSLANATATVSLAPGETVTCVFTNSQRGPVEIEKTSLGPVTRDGETYTVAYDLEVTTQSTITEAFTLSDVPTFADGVLITSTVVTGPAPATDEVVLPLDSLIDPGQTLNYTATFTFTIDGDVPISARTCDGSSTATFNTATVTSFVSSDNQTSFDCEDIPDPDISVDKSAVTDPVQPVYLGGDAYTVAYDVVVTNDGEGPGSYTLTEAPDFGDGVNITGISATSTDGSVEADFSLIQPNMAVAVDLPADASDTYRVVVEFDIDGTATLPERDCTGEPGDGAFNSVSIVVNGFQGDPADACVELPDPDITIEKVAAENQPVWNGGSEYAVTYTVTVDNVGDGPGAYTLTDTPDFGEGATITHIAISGNGVNIDPYTAGDAVITDEEIDPDEAAHVYTVVVTFDVSGSMTPEARTCSDAGEPGFGAFNSAEVTFNGPTVVDDDDCVDIRQPSINVDKSAVTDPAQPVYVGGDDYTVTYEVVVTNEGDGPGEYSLVEAPDFGEGIVLTAMSATSADGAVEADFALGQPNLATTVDLPAGESDTYVVTIAFSVPGSVTLDERDCNQEPGNGAYNSVSVTINGEPGDPADACVELPDPDITIDKVAGDDQPVAVDGDTYTVTYALTVNNIGDGPGDYTLTDNPMFGSGTTITNIAISGNGVDIADYTAGDDVIADEQLDPDEAPHTYTVVVTFDVDGAMTPEARVCDPVDGRNTATYNSATVTFNGGSDDDNDCVNIPEPDISFDKTSDSIVRSGDNEFTVAYTLTVTNAADAGPAEYDLDDEITVGPGVTVTNVDVTLAPVGSSPISSTTGVTATDVAIDAGEMIHTYQVVITVLVDPADQPDGVCNPETDGGITNSLRIDVRDVEGEPISVCDEFSTLTLVKETPNDDGAELGPEAFNLTAIVGDTTVIDGPGPSQSAAVLPGDYDLDESPRLDGYTIIGFTCGDAAMTDQTVSVEAGANVVCTIVNDDDPVDLELTKDDGGAEAVAGGAPFEYTISVQNIGGRDIDLDEPVTVTDDLPTPLEWVSFPDTCTQAGQVLTCDIAPADLPAGGSPVVISATVQAPAGTPSGDYVNRASVTTEDDPATDADCPALDDNNVDCEDTPVDREGGVQIIKTDDVADGASVQPGDTFTYELVVSNTGVSTLLPGTHVEDDLPEQLVFVSAVGGAGWTCNDSDPIDCDYAPELAPGAAAPAITVTVSVVENATGENIENVAIVRAAVDRDCPPTNPLTESFEPACNEVTDDDDEVTPLSANADLAIIKTASVEVIGAGGAFEWVLDITNNGPGTAVNVVIGDLVPPTVVVTGVSSSDFECGNDRNTVSCTIASLAVGASGTVTIEVDVPLTAPGGDVVNVGTVESDTPDPDLSNNSDEASVTIVAIAPPTTTLPPVTLPPTGSNGTDPLTRAGIVFLLLGGAFVLITRRRRHDEVVSG